MGTIDARSCRLKTGETCSVRAAHPDDASRLLEHARSVIQESEFLLTTAEEFRVTLEDERELIEQALENPGTLVLVAEEAGRLMGVLFLESGPKRRHAHRAILHLSIHRAWRGRGLGTVLLETAIDWARQHPTLEKLGLSVFATNTTAIGLYRKLGFEEEGRQVREIRLGPGRYVDQVLMYRFV